LYEGSYLQVSSVQTTIVAPNDTAVYGDNYYELLSIYDNQNYYDQIGMASYYGTWQFMWSTWAQCGLPPAPANWSNHSFSLHQNTQYTFVMSISGGKTLFDIYLGSGTGALLQSNSYPTGASYFIASNTACGNSDYRVFEEIYNIASNQLVPNWAFSFDNLHAGGSPVSSWSVYWPQPPGDIQYKTINNNALILNEPFSLSTTLCGSGQGMCATTISLGGQGTVSGSAPKFFPGNTNYLYLSTYYEPSGYSASFNPSQLWAGNSFTMTLTTPSSGCPSTPIGIKALDSGGVIFTTLRFQVWISGCGGGCVAWGTPILTPTAYVPIQKLPPGASVEEYNFLSQQLESGTLVSANSTNVSELTEINRGLLFVTPTDQPVFIRNATFEGWLHDPQNLTVADSLFDPVTQGWIQITNVQFVHHHTTVFDVSTSGDNNFVANGALLDKKT